MKAYPKILIFSVIQAGKPFSLNEIAHKEVSAGLFRRKLNFREVDIVKNRISFPGFMVVVNDQLTETALKLIINDAQQELYLETTTDRNETRVIYQGGHSVRMGKLQETKPNALESTTLYLYDKMNRCYYDIKPVAFGATNVSLG